MTLVDVGPIQVPIAYRLSGGNWNIQNLNVLSSEGNSTTYILSLPKTGDITSIGFRTGTVTTGGSIRITLEGVTSGGVADGTPIITDAEAIATIDDTDDNSWIDADFHLPISVNQGDLVAIKFTHIGDSANLALSNFSNLSYSFPYRVSGGTIIAALKYSDDIYYPIPGVFPISGVASDSFDVQNTDIDDEIGIKFRMPFNCTINGFWFSWGATANREIRLYNESDTILTSQVFNSSVGTTAPGDDSAGYFPNTINISANTWYRLTQVLLEDPGTPSQVLGFTFPNLAVKNAAEGNIADDFIWTSRQRGGSWNDESLKLPTISIQIKEIDT